MHIHKHWGREREKETEEEMAPPKSPQRYLNVDCSGEPPSWAPLCSALCHLQPEPRRESCSPSDEVGKPSLPWGGSRESTSRDPPEPQWEGGIPPGWCIYSGPLPGGPGSRCVFPNPFGIYEAAFKCNIRTSHPLKVHNLIFLVLIYSQSCAITTTILETGQPVICIQALWVQSPCSRPLQGMAPQAPLLQW